MANDNLRSGPLGATAQASKLGYRIVKLSAGAHATAATAVVLGKAAAASGVMGIVKATADNFGWLFPTCHAELMGGEWVIESLQVVFTDSAVTTNVTFDVGIYAQNPATGALKVVDANALVEAKVITHGAASTVGTIVPVALDGAGANAEYYNTAAGNKVTTTIGEGVGTFADDNTAITGHNQFLYLTNTTSTGAGTYIVYAVCKPVGGAEFKK
jgi:hypothetical protein